MKPRSRKAPLAESQSYLSRLSATPEMLRSPIAKYMTNIRLVLLLMITITLLGFMAYLSLPKRLNPEVKIPIVTVVTVLPGAGPSDVESLVTNPIEDELKSLTDIDLITSSSVDNVSVVTIQFLSSVDGEKAKTDVQSKIDSVNDLPSDAQDSQVTLLDFEDQPVLTFALITTKSFPDLMRTAKELQTEIEDIPEVDRVNVSGYDEHEVVVEANVQKLAEYGLNPFSLSQALKRARASYPAGTIETNQNTFALTVDPTVETLSDIRNLQLSSQGQVVTLSDIATVSERSKPGQYPSFLATPEAPAQRAVTFAVHKTTGTDIDKAGAAVETVVDEYMEHAGSDYRLVTLSNTSEEITEQFSDLLGEFRTTIILVMIVLWLFIGIRQSLISALTVPLTFLSAFFLMQFFGMSINFLTLFAFLLALGLLVDDTIVVVSAMTSYFRSGRFTPLETGALVWRDTIIPIWSTTITTIWSFVPLLITSGIIGEFIKPIPIVVTITMLSSTAIAVLITLPLMIVFLKPRLVPRVQVLLKILGFLAALAVIYFLSAQTPLLPLIIGLYIVFALVGYRLFPRVKAEISDRLAARKARATTNNTLAGKVSNAFGKVANVFRRSADHGLIDVVPFANWYRCKILQVLNNRGSRRAVVIGVIAYSLFSFALLPLGFVKNEFFPKTDQNQLFVQLELPAGTLYETTTQEATVILEQLRHTPETDFVTADIGQSGQMGGGGGNNLANFSLRLHDAEDRKASSVDIAEDLRRQFETYNRGRISVVEQSGGPPAGADLQITLSGSDLGELNRIADQIQDYLQSEASVTNVNKSVKEGTSKVVFVPDMAQLAANGVTMDTIGGTLRVYASGFTLDTLELGGDGSEKTDVVMRLNPDTATVEDLSQLSVINDRGASLPLLSLGRLESRVNPTSIVHEDFQRSIAVTAAIRPGYNVTTENQKLESFANSLTLPDGYAWKTGGVNEENNESINSILQAMVLSSILILITMVVQFGSFREAVIVLIVIPLAVSSVFLAYALTGTPLSFPAMIGILSLFGIIVTNSMFIVDKINLNRREGMEFKEAIADAGASRMEPIILTKLCTVFGLLPITIADPLWRGLGGAIISGLLVASTIMLLFIPVLYYNWMKTDTEN